VIGKHHEVEWSVVCGSASETKPDQWQNVFGSVFIRFVAN